MRTPLQILSLLIILAAFSVAAQAQVARKDIDSVIWNLNLEEVVVIILRLHIRRQGGHRP